VSLKVISLLKAFPIAIFCICGRASCYSLPEGGGQLEHYFDWHD